MNLLMLIGIFAVCAIGAKYFLKGKDKAAEYKKYAAQLALKLAKYGMRRFPEILSNAASSDAADAIKEIVDTLKLFVNSDEELFKELDATFNSVLTEKLKTPEGRSVIDALLKEAVNAASAAKS